MACPGLAIHTLAGLCALLLPSSISTSVKDPHSAKPHPHILPAQAGRSTPVQAPPDLLHTAETAFDLAVAYGMSRAIHSHTSRALCAVVAEQRLNDWKTPAFSTTAPPTNDLPSPAAEPSEGSTRPAAHCSTSRVAIGKKWDSHI